ncbi:hypothetical protein P280DRAFT_394814 [Massarina eburnea CBS 473.64]|uniref:Nascent polypeptide-associated complex subunit alpha-like UBA domain-containing protein n=1 Tax=Massarina eburnea CBS 473.64 TaxID=1395130 RepID=A0A6A6S755_9PLEO|nr:hypothetical protein P280DRAFT_394814 [Massarina eburnea CBS 473.64]
MAEPQPAAIQEGAAEPHAPTGSAEDRKAAAALSSLDAPTQDDDAAGKKNVDSKALGEAMKGLSVKEHAGDEKKKVVKIEASDVSLLASELEIPKQKATDLLRASDGNVLQAISSFITP